MSGSSYQTKYRPPGLVLLVIYKLGSAIVLFTSAIAIWLAGVRHLGVSEYALPSHRFIISWILQHLAQIPPHTLQFAAIAAGAYGTISAVEAIGLWLGRHWARWLLLIGIGASLPFEAVELFHHMSWIRLILLIANSFAFWYVLKRFPRST
ncbi:MAG: DUF2127 domain-containing protein [Plectolyngbya sp. WJT66-NPBG17]|jgi:uncharacterized membrane protein (DUF2068 family)|nr:DUF2127 domain-containing protein [Plectolyngbya sp. WJT66-NPBG17]